MVFAIPNWSRKNSFVSCYIVLSIIMLKRVIVVNESPDLTFRDYKKAQSL
jgi:hypothetical protein